MTALVDAVPFLRRHADAGGQFAGTQLSEDVACLLDSPGWRAMRNAIVECVVEEETSTPIGQLVPGMSAVSGDPVGTAPLRRRSRTTLARARVSRWGDLLAMTPADLLRVPSAGALTVRDIVGICLDLAMSAVAAGFVPSVPDDDGQEPEAGTSADGADTPAKVLADAKASALNGATRAVRLVAAWASRERDLRRMVDILPFRFGGSVPPDIAEALEVLAQTDPALLASEGAYGIALDHLASTLMDVLEPQQRVAFERRVLDNDATLEVVGTEMSITRERVRQLQAAAEARIAAELTGERFAVLRWRAWDLSSALGRAAPSEDVITQEAIARALRGSSAHAERLLRPLLLQMAGPYRERDGWIVRADVPPLAVKELISLADDHGLIPLPTAYGWLAEHGIRAEFHDQWLTQSGRFRHEGERLLVWSGGAVAKSIALLAFHGTPMDAETLVGLIGEGHNLRGIRARYFEEPRIMRVSRSLWALRSWGMDEYTGIAEEIAQRIQEWGGRAKLQRLIDELVPLFGVREISVRTYAQAPMFVQENGWVRLRGDDEPFMVSSDVSESRGVFLHEDGVSVLLTVDGDTLRGSGRLFPQAAAAVLGVVPGQRRTFSHAEGALTLSWPVTAGLGPSAGSIRFLAKSMDAEVDDYLRLTFHNELGLVEASRISPNDLVRMSGPEAIAALSGTAQSLHPEAELATAIGVSPSSVRRALQKRGDALLVRLLPETSSIDGLDAALSELVKLLDASE